MKTRHWGIVLLLSGVFCTSGSIAQTISVFDTVYVPTGYTDGSGLARMFVPEMGNGIGVVLVHGCGNDLHEPTAWCDTLASYGYVAMSIEYPDPCLAPEAVYPKKTRAVKLAVEFLRRNAVRFGITTGKIVGLGLSQGAATWGEAIIWDNDDAYFQTDPAVDDHVDAAILLYGYYRECCGTAGDSVFWSNYFANDSLRVNKANCLAHVENITTPVLLMHGTGDFVVPYQESVLLHDSLTARGKLSELVPFAGLPHAFDINWPSLQGFTPAGLIAKDTGMAFLERVVAPSLKIRLSSTSVNFGYVSTASSETLSMRIDNIGRQNLRLDSITHLDGNYTLVNVPSFPAEMSPRSSLNLQIAFRPTSTGVFRDTIAVASDDTMHPLVKIALHGRGISAIAVAQPGVMYVTGSGQPEGRLYTINTATGALTPVGTLGISEIRGMAIRPSTQQIYGTFPTAAGTNLYRITSDSGVAAYDRTVPLANLRAIAFSPGDTLYGATTSGKLYRIDLTTGETVFLGSSPALTYLGLSFSPTSGTLWACVRTPLDSIFQLSTTDGSAAFVGVTGFTALTNALAFDPSGNLFGLIDNGTGEDYFASIDTITAAGSIIAGPLPIANLQAMAMRTDSLLTSVDEHPEKIPQSYVLGQNYPNPFNPLTIINYGLPHADVVTLKVFDVLGREVATLVNGMKQPGEYSVRWDASNMPSGVYFYRLQAGSYDETKKLLLVR